MFMILVLSFSVAPFAIFADDINIEDSEAAVLADQTGAQVRLLQLEKMVEVQIENAQDLVLELETDVVVVDERLTEIIEEFESILISIEEFNLNSSTNEVASEYVALKAEAIDLSQEFKNLMTGKFTETKTEEIRERHQENIQVKNEEKNEKLEELKNKYDAKKVEQFMKHFGNFTDNELLRQVGSGELNLEQIKTRLKEEYNKLDSIKKENVLKETRESNEMLQNKIQIQNGELLENAEIKRTEFEQKTELRRSELKEILDVKMEQLKLKKMNSDVEMTKENGINYINKNN